MRYRTDALRLAFALCMITAAVNLQVPLYTSYAHLGGFGVMATAVAFSCYVAGVLPVLLTLGGLSDRIGRKPVVLLALVLSMAATLLMLVAPRLDALGAARWLAGVGTGLMSATASAYMADILESRDSARVANWVTCSSSIGFCLGAAATSLCLLFQHSLRPPSFWLHLALACLAFTMLLRMPEPARHTHGGAILQLPHYPKGSLPFGAAILLSWAASGVGITVLPSILAACGLSRWAGLSTTMVIGCGLLLQPLARRLPPEQSVRIGLVVLGPAFALLAWGALNAAVAAVLLGAFAISCTAYALVYLGGLAAVTSQAGAQKARVSAGFFLMAYVGFSAPVVLVGMLADRYGRTAALVIFLTLLSFGIMAVLAALRSFRTYPTGAIAR